MKAEITARILQDSITEGGSRLTTWELTYPRFVHAEFMTHRALSRNSASSRAIPAAKLRQRVLDLTATPVHWGANQKGMQAHGEIEDTATAENWWLRGRDLMVQHHEEGERLGLHKQIVNRVIEPWMMITVICSFTDGANFFSLRDHGAAEHNIARLALLMRDLYFDTLPAELPLGAWHMPLLREDDHVEARKLAPNDYATFLDGNEDDIFQKHDEATTLEVLKKVSTGRCARVSYLTHDGRRDLLEDIKLHDQLAATATLGADPMHASPFEHVAVAVGNRERHGNFEGWKQYRKFFPKENGPDTSVRCTRCGRWGGLHVRGCPNA